MMPNTTSKTEDYATLTDLEKTRQNCGINGLSAEVTKYGSNELIKFLK